MNKENSLLRFRTPEFCLNYLREIDPDTCISLGFIRKCCQNGVVLAHKCGTSLYVCLDSLLEYLNRGFETSNEEKIHRSKLWKKNN